MIGLISIFLATSLVVNFIFYRGSSKYVVYSLSFLFIAFLQSHYWDFSFDSGGFRVTSFLGWLVEMTSSTPNLSTMIKCLLY